MDQLHEEMRVSLGFLNVLRLLRLLRLGRFVQVLPCRGWCLAYRDRSAVCRLARSIKHV